MAQDLSEPPDLLYSEQELDEMLTRPRPVLVDFIRTLVSPLVILGAAVTKSGRTFTGILASETATSITLKGQEGKEEVLLRTELDELQSTGKSLMPEGLEKDLSRQDLADLLAYLAGGR